MLQNNCMKQTEIYSSVPALSLNIGGCTVIKREYVKISVLPLIQNFTFNKHQKAIFLRAYFHLRNISRICNSLSAFSDVVKLTRATAVNYTVVVLSLDT